MTRREAIKNLQDIKSMYTWSTGADEALDMAIKSLETNKTMEISSNIFGVLAICAIRYCHGRRSYMPSLVQGIVMDYLTDIQDNDLYVMIKDCESMMDFDFGSEQIDKPRWLRFRNDLEVEWKRRGNADRNGFESTEAF